MEIQTALLTGSEGETSRRFYAALATSGPGSETFSLFSEMVRAFYRAHARSMAWRETRDPYRVLISEVMLQQTQVNRVKEKYPQFIEAFPTFASLADAPLSAVLERWQGLGYNRRAVALHRAAGIVVSAWGGVLREDPADLVTLPGIGKATAASVAAFAFNRPTVFIETNIRRVFIHCFCRDQEGVTDREILPLVERTLDQQNPREWYYALMDYGTFIAAHHSNPNKKSAHYTKQSRFEGSDRQVRGRILRLVRAGPARRDDMTRELGEDSGRVGRLLLALKAEGFLEIEGDMVRIRS